MSELMYVLLAQGFVVGVSLMASLSAKAASRAAESAASDSRVAVHLVQKVDTKLDAALARLPKTRKRKVQTAPEGPSVTNEVSS